MALRGDSEVGRVSCRRMAWRNTSTIHRQVDPHVVGKLRYVLPERYDLAYPMWLLSKKMSQPTYENLAQLKRLVRYLLGTTSLKLILKESTSEV